MLRTKRNYSISTIRTVLEIVAVGQKVELLVIVLWLTINAPHLTYAPQKYWVHKALLRETNMVNKPLIRP